MNIYQKNIRKLSVALLFFVMQIASAQYKMPVAHVSSLQPAQSGNEAGMSIDNDISTLYHSKYDLSTAIPDQLDFHFSKRVKSISQLIYQPRQSGTNGIWTSVKIKYSNQSNPTVFADATGTISWNADNTAKTINLTNTIVNPAIIRIEVLNAENNFSSCAEMEFYSTEQLEPVLSECLLSTGEFSGYADILVQPLATGSSASNFQPGNEIEKSFDGDLNTVYHSNWNTTTFPISLIYKFDGQTAIDYVKYIPRQDNNVNGNFGNIKISYNTVSDTNFVEVYTGNFEQTGTSKTAYLPLTIIPLNIKIEILDGKNNFASCAEMQFFRTDPNTPNFSMYSGIFADSLFSILKPTVTQQDINAIASPFIKGLAQCLFNNTYNKKYRIGSFTAYKKNETINNQYKIGNYNAFENPTGIAFQTNETVVVFAKDINSLSNKVYLKIRDFSTEGGTSQISPESLYELKNGFNVFKITNAGLGYISYYTNDINASPVTVNITTGMVNGIYKTGTPASEWAETLTNGVFPKIDIQGYYTALVMDKSAVSNFHFTNPQPLVDKYDMIVKSQRELMGFFKYDTNFKNRQNVYTESVGGWFAGNLGVHLDLTWGLPNTASAEGLDIWGIAHEFGHTNQVRPGLRWTGTGEITNNLYSAWAYYNMYTPAGSNRFTRLEGEVADQTDFPQIAGNRYGEFIIQTQIKGKNLMDQFRTNFVNPKDKNFRSLIPFWQLELYYQLAGASKGASTLAFDSNMSDEGTQTSAPISGVDYAHWLAYVIKKVKETDESQLSQGQLVMNFVKNTCDAVQEDLTDFFINTGFLRPIDGTMDDYVPQQLTITQNMIDDVKSYILSKGYAKPVSPVINYISAHSVNIFKNKLPLSGVTGIGVQTVTNGQGSFILVENALWNNAVAFETYDASNQLISVSIVGTGDTTLEKTYVDFPSGAQKVYAVGFNGQKILVYPSGTLAVNNTEVSHDYLTVFPNPLKNGERLNVQIKNVKGNLNAKVYDASGKLVVATKGSVGEINEQLNDKIRGLKSGVYFIVLFDNSNTYSSKIIKE